ncbi:MAG: PadR family transcriptional regulator [Firmicutes bacterium]|nr:PadR family transcriptional regulator [Bacillota bacterium]
MRSFSENGFNEHRRGFGESSGRGGGDCRRESSCRRGSECREQNRGGSFPQGGCHHEMGRHRHEGFEGRPDFRQDNFHGEMHHNHPGMNHRRFDDERMGGHHGFHHERHGRDEHFGFGFFREMGRRGEKGGKARRGETRYLILDALRNGPIHGYEIIKNLEERSGGQYAPSPGSVYPILQYLEDLNFVEVQKEGDRRVFSITVEGLKELTANEDKVRLFWSRFEAPNFSAEAETEIRCMREDMHLMMEIIRDGVHEALRRNDIDSLNRLRQIISDCREAVKNELSIMLASDKNDEESDFDNNPEDAE